MEPSETPSKTRRKRQMHDLQGLGEQLVRLNDDQLARMSLPDALLHAVQDARRIKSREARRRQLQFVGRLMREVDADPIRTRLADVTGQSREHTAWLHLIERWRERLLTDEDAFRAFAEQHPGADLQRLKALARGGRKERDEGGPPRSFRALFDALRAIIPPPGVGKPDQIRHEFHPREGSHE